MGNVREDHTVARWVDLVGDLLLDARPTFPVMNVMSELHATFGTEVAWFWREPDGSFGFELYLPVPEWPRNDDLLSWADGLLDAHPLMVWYGQTGDLTAGTLHRVPRSAVPRVAFEQVRTLLRPVGLDRQLSLPYQAGTAFRSFLVCATGTDFDDEAVSTARRIQPLLTLLARQVSVLEQTRCPDAAAPAVDGLLTGREQAVLRLLAAGHTATAIARRLGISPRTVHQHLAHLYRKLSVNDRLRARPGCRGPGAARPSPRPRGHGTDVRSHHRPDPRVACCRRARGADRRLAPSRATAHAHRTADADGPLRRPSARTIASRSQVLVPMSQHPWDR